MIRHTPIPRSKPKKRRQPKKRFLPVPIDFGRSERVVAQRKAPVKKKGAARERRQKVYRAFLKSPAWKTIRTEALERAGHQCEQVHAIPVQEWYGVPGSTPKDKARFVFDVRCTSTARLEVHHVRYTRPLGQERPKDLKVLCRDCHQRHHALNGVPKV